MADVDTVASEFMASFPAIYLRFHRRDGKHDELPPASRAVLQHMALAGPVTVGELCAHLQRSQSVVSEIVAGLEGRGLVERQVDPADRRRRLVWLSDCGLRLLEQEREVLSTNLLRKAISAMLPADREALLRGVAALLAADRQTTERPALPTHVRPPRRKNNG